MIKVWSIIGLFLMAQQLLSQNFYAAYEKAYAQYESATNVAYDISYVSLGKTALIDKTTMHVELVDGITYTQMNNIQSFNFDSTSVIIDNDNRQIQLNVGIPTPSINIQNLLAIKELIKTAEREGVQKREGEKWHSLYFKGGDFSAITMVVDAKTGGFKKMQYHLANALVNAEVEKDEPVEVLEIQFNNYQKNKTAFTQPLENFLQFDGKRFTVQKKYSNYQFVNNYDLH